MAVLARPQQADDVAEILVTTEQIATKVRELGARIAADYQGKDVVLVSILKGALPFLADLMRAAQIPLALDFLEVSSYGAGTESTGAVRILKDLANPIEGRHVLVVEDILDTGHTLSYVFDHLRAQRPESVRLCVLLDKPARRVIPIDIDYRASEIPDKFVVGYGLDFAARYRSLLQLFRETRLHAEVEDIPIVTIPFEFAVESDGSGPLAAPLFSAQQITPMHYVASGGLLTFNGRAYRGTLDVTRDDEGDMIVVNQVDTASYLASVIGSEEPTTWMPEALAAQAIAARTYLSTHLARHDNYDLEGDTRDQEYDGLAGEAASTVKAVDRTAGMIATYNGRAIEALYSANAGGITEDSEHVYANALPYLRSVPSPADEIAQASSWGHTRWPWTTECTGAAG